MGTQSGFARALLATALLLTACSSPPAPGNDAALREDAAAAADTNASAVDMGGGGGDPLLVRVVDSDRMPVAGAVVALDRPSGMRVEQTTGADGVARFDVDWANGPFDTIAWAPGHSARANLDIDRATYEHFLVEGQLWMFVSPLTPAPTITVTGAFTGLADPADYISVVSTAGLPGTRRGNWFGQHGPYSLPVPANTAFRLIVTETVYAGVMGTRDFTQTVVNHAVTPEHAGVTADLTLDLDVTMNAAPETTVSGSFSVPSATPGFFDVATMAVTVLPHGSLAFSMGVPTLAHFAADGRSVDYTIAYVVPPGVTAMTSYYGLNAGDRQSSALLDGAPVAGPQTFALIAPPEVRELMPGSFPHVFDTVVITNPVAAARPSVNISTAVGPRYTVLGSPGQDHVVIPPLPTGADPAVLFAGGLGRQVTQCVQPPVFDPDNITCALYSAGLRTPVDP